MTLKDLRAAHEPPLTQTQLAQAAHISLRMVQDWEAGRRSIDRAGMETLCDLAYALDCKLWDLVQSPLLLTKLLTVIKPRTPEELKQIANSFYGITALEDQEV